MNTDQLDRAIRLYAKRFDGVFSSDRLPAKPRLLVCNTDTSDESGEHWIVIYVDEWIDNCKQLQSIVSRFCGHYCASFCILKSNGIDMCRFLRHFTRDTGLNDVIVHELMCNV